MAVGLLACHGQGFINLDFELANVAGLGCTGVGCPVPITAGLPGWRGFIGTMETDMIWHNQFSLGSPALVIHDRFPYVLEGNYSALLTGSGVLSDHAVSISQSGLVPGGSLSARFNVVGRSDVRLHDVPGRCLVICRNVSRT